MAETVHEPETQMRVYRYALVGDLPPEGIEELHRANNLWNTLVDYHRDYADAIAAIWAQYPELAALDDQIAAQEEHVGHLRDLAKQHRINQRERADAPKQLKTAIKNSRAKLKRLRDERRDLKSRTFETTAEPLIKQANSDLNARIKTLYKTSGEEGLYWATFNEIVAHFRIARKAIAAKRIAGNAAELHFHSWTGEGTIAVQLQRGADQIKPTPAVVASTNSPWRNVAHLTPAFHPDEWANMPIAQHSRARHGTLRFRVGTGEHRAHISLEVLVNRPIPPDAEIKLMRITRRMEADNPKLHVSVVVRIPRTDQRTSGPHGAVHTGWRSLGDNAIRVAVATGIPNPPPPHLIANGVIRDHGAWQEIVIPGDRPGHKAWARILANTSVVRSNRDQRLDTFRDYLVQWLDEHPNVEPDAATVKQWRSPRRFAALHNRFEADPPPDSHELLERMSRWRRTDLYDWRREAAGRKKILGRRDNAYREVAAWLCAETRALTVDGWTIPGTRKAQPEEAETWQDRLARAKRTIAAPFTLTCSIAKAAEARGVAITKWTGAISTTHHGCGGTLDAEARREAIMVRCETCGNNVDQDVSALGHLLAASTPVD